MSKKKSDPIINMDVKEFILSLGTGKSLQYRNNWLKNKVKECGLKINFKKKNGKLVIGIHQKYLHGRKLHNPYYKDGAFTLDGKNCLVDKDKYNEDDDRASNLERLKSKGYVYYYAHKTIKGFLFYLIKNCYDGDKEIG